MSGFGSCGTGSGRSSLVSPKYITSGSQTVNPGYQLDEDGGYSLQEDGSKIYLESPQYRLNEDGSYALSEDGTRILLEGSSPSEGSATQLITVATACQYVSISAKPGNYDVIWVSGSDVAENVGIPLYARGAPMLIPIDDVSKVYIWGTVGDGATFFYGTVALPGDLTFLGSPLTFGGDPLA